MRLAIKTPKSGWIAGQPMDMNSGKMHCYLLTFAVIRVKIWLKYKKGERARYYRMRNG